MKCFDCGSGRREDGYNRLGWYYLDCGRRYNPQLDMFGCRTNLCRLVQCKAEIAALVEQEMTKENVVIRDLLKENAALKQAIKEHDEGCDKFYCWSIQKVVDALPKGADDE